MAVLPAARCSSTTARVLCIYTNDCVRVNRLCCVQCRPDALTCGPRLLFLSLCVPLCVCLSACAALCVPLWFLQLASLQEQHNSEQQGYIGLDDDDNNMAMLEM